MGAPAPACSLASPYPRCWSLPERLSFQNLPVLSTSTFTTSVPFVWKSLRVLPLHTQATSGLSFWKVTESSLSCNCAQPPLESHTCSWTAKATSRWCWKGHHISPKPGQQPARLLPPCPLSPDASRGVLPVTLLLQGEGGFPGGGRCLPCPSPALGRE